MSVSKRKLTGLTIDQKIEILNALQSKSKTRKELAVQFGCDLSTIARIVQQETKIRSVAVENGNTSRKRLRRGNYEEIDEAVAVWFRQMRANNVIVNGLMIQEAATKIAEKLNILNFKPSNGWLGRWKAKENVSFQNQVKRSADQAGSPEQLCQQMLHVSGSVQENEQEAQQAIPHPPSFRDALSSLAIIRAYFEHINVDLNNVNALEDQFCDISADQFKSFRRKCSTASSDIM